MTIAGIKAEYDMRTLIEHPPAYVPHGIDLYTTEQVRDILVKQLGDFADFPPYYYGEVVDEFMKGER